MPSAKHVPQRRPDRQHRLPSRGVALLLAVIGLGLLCEGASSCFAETLNGALVKSYRRNPSLNAQRAGTRAADENVPIANSGYLPHADLSGDIAYGAGSSSGPGSSRAGGAAVAPVTTTTGTAGSTGTSGTSTGFSSNTAASQAASSPVFTNGSGGNAVPRGLGLQVSQTLFDGFQTRNAIRQAESGVFSSRETLRTTEQSILQSAAQSYMDVLRDTALVELRGKNIAVIAEQLRQSREYLAVGQATQTDVAQSNAALAGARADYGVAVANLQNSIASYRQVVGELPARLEPARPLTKGLPASLAQAIAVSQIEHPNVQAAMHDVDAAELQVKILEGALTPQVALVDTAAIRSDVQTAGDLLKTNQLGLSATVPIYQGSAPYAQIRQAKERVSASRLQVAVVQDQVRAAIVSAWGLLESSTALLQSQQAQVAAAQLALEGVRQELKAGERTTLDVLNAQQALLNARVGLVAAQRDRVVSTYAILASIGRLSLDRLGLQTTRYDPVVHFNQVKDKWLGLRTPDGR